MSFYIVVGGKSERDDATVLNVQLPKTYRIRVEWEVGIVSSIIELSVANMIWVICDVMGFNAVNNISMQLVAIVPSGIRKNLKPMYVGVQKKTFTCIKIELRLDFDKEVDID